MSVVPIPARRRGTKAIISPLPSARVFPTLASVFDWREPYLVPLLLLVLTRGVLAALLPLASEDAYITYRYSRNLALGLGPVFNPGEHVMGFTSPLWMVWNAIGCMLTHNPVLWSRLSTGCGDVVTLLVAGAMLVRHVSRTSAWCFAFVFATWTAFTGIAISGMESSMMVTLLVLGAALAEKQSRAAGPVLGALALIRPEGFVAAAILALRAPARQRIVAAAIAGVGLLVLTLYYGSPIPQSVIAKASIYGMAGPWAGRQWWEWISPFALGRWPVMPDARFLFLGTVIAAPAAFLGARALWPLRRTGLAQAVAAMLGVWLLYVTTGTTYFYWYMIAPLAAWFLLVAIGLPRIVRGPAVYVSAALLVLGSWTVVWELYAGRAHAEESFVRVGQYLEQHATPWQKVLLEPIGLIGYRAKVVVLDEVGLVSPKIARRRLEGPGWMSDVIAAERPDWLVLRRGVVERLEAWAGAGAPFRSPVERDDVLARYARATMVAEEAGDAALVVMRRRR